MHLFDKNHKNFLTDWKLDAFQNFEWRMTNKEKPFPCIPATLGFSLNQLRYGFIGDPRELSTAENLAFLLKEFTIYSRDFGDYTSLIIFFKTSQNLMMNGSIDYFEQLFWAQLNTICILDEQNWPEHLPNDPTNHLWEFCFHGEPCFIYCATPLHQKRHSRYFPYLMLAITPRWVLDKFNQNTKHAESLKMKIRKRLIANDSVSIHPHLNQYRNLENFEWKQYFLHDDETAITECPFHKTFLKDKVNESDC